MNGNVGWEVYHSALSQCAELLDNMKDGDLITNAPKFLAEKLASIPPHYRGYARLGTGQYLLNHSAAGSEAEFIISVATEDEKAGRVVGDERDNVPGKLLQPEAMAVRIAFTSVAGLDAMEARLHHLRAEHFPASAPQPSIPSESIESPEYDGLVDALCYAATDAQICGGDLNTSKRRAGADAALIAHIDAYATERFRQGWFDGAKDAAELATPDAAPLQEMIGPSALLQAAKDFAQAHIDSDSLEDKGYVDPSTVTDEAMTASHAAYNSTKARLLDVYRALQSGASAPQGLAWTETAGGAMVSGPYSVPERVDNKGWNATALFEDERGWVDIVLAVPKDVAMLACEKHAALAAAPANVPTANG